MIAAAMAGFAVGPMFLLLIGHFNAGAAVPLGLVGAAVGCWLAGLPDGPVQRRDAFFTCIALLVVLLWFFYNARFAAQDVYATRDPATYTITGQWLVHHGSLQIHTHPEIFGSPAAGQAAAGPYALIGNGLINAQGDHLLPVLLGLSGSIFGTTALLATNTFLAALALLVFFALARRIVGPLFGLMALLALGLSMPFIYVGRDAYTEPLTMLFLMGSLLFAHRAWTSHRAQDWALCGLAAGASTCVRVDSYGALLGVVAAITVYAAVGGAAQWRHALRAAGALLVGAVPLLVLGYLDLTRLSRQYYGSQHANITHLIGLLVVVTLLSPACVWLAWRSRVRAWAVSATFLRRGPQLTAFVLTLVFIALATRPHWQRTHGACHSDLANMQSLSGVAVDCTRTYNEQTLRWQAMYFGWPTIALAFAGYAVLVAELLRRRRYELVGTLAMGLSMSALYLYNVEAAPDQPWAMRRYIPVIVPLFLVATAAALRAAWRWTEPRWLVVRPMALRPLVVAGVLFVVCFPLAVAWPMRHVREEHGQLAQVKAICTAVGKRGAIVETDAATIFGYGQSVRSFCNVPAIGIENASAEQIAQIAAAVRAHGRVPYVLGQCDVAAPVSPPCSGADGAGKTSAAAFSVVQVQRWPTAINKAPDMPDQQQYAVWLSSVDESGQARPVAPVTTGR